LAGFLRVSKEMAGIEMACWDITGKALGVPVHALLGGKMRDSVRVYANGWYSGDRTPEGFADRAKVVTGKGYTALKFDPFGTAYLTMSKRESREAEALVAAVRESVGPDVDILIEAHDRFSVGQAIEIGNWLAKYEVTWFETPVYSTDIDALVEVARRVPVRVIAGERMHDLHEFAQFLATNVTDVINPEPLGVGGVFRSVQIAGLARAHHAQIALHNAESPLKTAIALQIDAVTPNVFIQECFDDFLEPWVTDVLQGFPRVRDGEVEIPDAPGYGVTLNEAEAKKHPYGKSNFLRMFKPGWERRDVAKTE
ncbi:MAG: mandelate racemase/muconate lactonizing enzyme family protein, partial [Chloroflexi bacterium]|nr:mandelate racemase/muconate lactonizing enzyme family protein [Chloroflexota bacterium]